MHTCFFARRAFAVLVAMMTTTHAEAQQAAKPWPVRVVIVTTFEVGADTGDAPGEFQHWVEREHLDEVVPFPVAAHPLRANQDHTMLGMVSGTTTANAAASLMALGLDARFDLTHAYFLFNGIAGVDPADASVGSAAWARFVVGDVAREIDSREVPQSWAYGIFPVGSKAPQPDKVTAVAWSRSNLFPLNAGLAAWAYARTKDVALGDDDKVAALRASYKGFPAAQRAPFVLEGDVYASNQFWHGTVLTSFANDWVRLYTENKGNFVMASMEDAGFMTAVERLGAAGKIDPARVMLLRTGSNYTMPPAGQLAVESVNAPFVGTRLALESAWRVGSPVVRWLLAHWDEARDHIPGEKIPSDKNSSLP